MPAGCQFKSIQITAAICSWHAGGGVDLRIWVRKTELHTCWISDNVHA